MPPEQQTEQSDKETIKQLLEENQRLLTENNTFVKKMHRNMVWSFWARLLWYAVLIGLPFAVYFYVLEPYFTALGSSYETFNAGMQEIPGFKQIFNAIDQVRSAGGE